MITLLFVFATVTTPSPTECPGWLGFGFTYRTTQRHGTFAGGWMYVQDVAAGGPAARAGLARFDVITALNGEPLRYATDLPLIQRLSRLRPGEVLRLSVRRGATTTTRVVTAVPSPPERCRAWRENLDLARRRQ